MGSIIAKNYERYDIMRKKIIVDIPSELNDKLDQTKEKMMITKSAVVKIACNNYCNEALKQ